MAKRVDGGGGEVRLWRFVSIAPSQATVERLLLVLEPVMNLGEVW
jgi:hypothetical protein